MKKLIKSSFFLAALSAIGFFAYKFSVKMKEIKGKYDTSIFFNGKSLKFEGKEYRGGSYAVMFSGVEMDFTGATLLDDDATLEIYGECCGISIIVPQGWQVQVEGQTERGGFSNSTKYDDGEEFKPVLRIKYKIKYAGMEVKYN